MTAPSGLDDLFGNRTRSALRSRPLETFMDGFRTQGDVARFRLGPPFEAYLVAHPAGVDRVLRTHQQLYGKVPWHNNRFRELLGNGIATSEGERWLGRRRLAQPAFRHDRINNMVDAMAAQADGVARRWERQEPGAVVDMAREMMVATLGVATATLFGVSIGEEGRRLSPSIDVTLRHIIRRLESAVAWPLQMPLPRNREFVDARRELDRFIATIVDRHAAAGTSADTYLDLLIGSHDANETRLDATDVRDELMTMLMAGHESMAVCLTWTWYLLSQHPNVTERLRAEIDAVLGGRLPTASDLCRLTYTGMVIDEALRLYPPAWSTSRTPLNDDVICGTRIPRGKFVLLSPFVTHRHPDFWPEPETFRPERFANGVPRGDRRFSYYPFGGGPRQCLGLEFALAEGKVMLAVLAARFRPQLAPGVDVGFDPQVTLRPRGGMPMLVN